MKVIDFKAYDRKTLNGWVTIELASGLSIRDLAYHSKANARWLSYPSRPYEDKDGNTKYSKILFFEDKDQHFAFQKSALEALDAYLAANPETSPVPWDD